MNVNLLFSELLGRRGGGAGGTQPPLLLIEIFYNSILPLILKGNLTPVHRFSLYLI